MYLVGVFFLDCSGYTIHVSIGVLFGCFAGRIDGPGLPGGSIIYQGPRFPLKGRLDSFFPQMYLVGVFFLDGSGYTIHVSIGVLFGCFAGRIDGPGLPGGSIIYQGPRFPLKGRLGSFFSRMYLVGVFFLDGSGYTSHVSIGVLFGCFSGRIDGPGLPGGLVIYQGHLWQSISPERHLGSCFSPM